MKNNNMTSAREFLEQLSTKELDEMLNAELHKESIDDELVRLILEVLEERERNYPIDSSEEVTQAVEKYKAHLDGSEKAPAKPVRKWNGVLKAASVLVVVGLLLFALPQATNAENIFQMLARWTDSIFAFFDPAEMNDQQPYVFETDNPGLQEIYDTVVEMGITDPVVPMWVPDGFTLEEVLVFEEPSELTLLANMKCNESEICISIGVQSVRAPLNHTKDTTNVEILELVGVEHYILSNNEQINATWINKNIECSVVTDCQEDIYKILESIYTTEDQ